jgi:hypothetical protein
MPWFNLVLRWLEDIKFLDHLIFSRMGLLERRLDRFIWYRDACKLQTWYRQAAPRNDVMILKIFSPPKWRKNWRFWLETLPNYAKWDHNVFKKKQFQFVRLKSAKIADISDPRTCLSDPCPSRNLNKVITKYTTDYKCPAWHVHRFLDLDFRAHHQCHTCFRQRSFSTYSQASRQHGCWKSYFVRNVVFVRKVIFVRQINLVDKH